MTVGSACRWILQSNPSTCLKDYCLKKIRLAIVPLALCWLPMFAAIAGSESSTSMILQQAQKLVQEQKYDRAEQAAGLHLICQSRGRGQ